MTMRAFIAIELDPQIKKSLGQLVAKLNAKKCNVRWVKSPGMHLTLKFLGEVSSEKVLEVINVMHSVCKKYKAFPLKLAGTGTFPPGLRKPRVVWVGVDANKSLLHLQKELEEELAKISFPSEKRSYHPHLTLGRVKSGDGLSSLVDELENERGSEFGEMTVDEVVLFKSTLKPSGAEYTHISSSRLS
jgi:2'-5' RNA ligase